MQGASPLPREQLRGGAARGARGTASRGQAREWSRRLGVSLQGPGGRGWAEERGPGGTETETTTERNGQRGKGWRKGRDAQEKDERMKTWNYRETANKTEARGVHRTMFVVLHRDFFRNFFL